MNYNKIVRKQLRVERSTTDQTDRRGECDIKVEKDSKKEADNFMKYGRQLEKKILMGNLHIKVTEDGVRDGLRS